MARFHHRSVLCLLGALAVVCGITRPPAPVAALDVLRTVGDGTAGSCTDAALDTALSGGPTLVVFINFACGPAPKLINILSTKVIGKRVTIDGDNLISLSGMSVRTLFRVEAVGILQLRNIELLNGLGSADAGGAVRNLGRLTLDGVAIRQSRSDPWCGGGVFSTGPLTIIRSQLRDNVSTAGGALCMQPALLTSVVISDSVIEQNGVGLSSPGTGGAVYAGANTHLQISNTTFRRNSADMGGALYVDAGAVATVTASISGSIYPNTAAFEDNAATMNGGAIFNAGSLSVNRAYLVANSVPTATSLFGGLGGGIHNAGVLTVSNSLLSGNVARRGGGVSTDSSQGRLLVERSLLELNTAGDLGGGLFAGGVGLVIIRDSAFHLNSAAIGGGIGRRSAGLRVDDSSFTLNRAGETGAGLWLGPVSLSGTPAGAPITLTNVTIAGNISSLDSGGGILNAAVLDLQSVSIIGNDEGVRNEPGGVIRLRGSVISNDGFANCAGGTVVDNGFNHVTDATCGAGLPAKAATGLDALVRTDTGLQYAPPGPRSPLIDTGPPDCTPLDQRGAARVGRCDIGAVEFNGNRPHAYLPQVLK
jgi:hypothetical protein